MRFAVDPSGNTIIAIRYVADRSAISLAAFVALPVLEAVDRRVDAIGIVAIDLVFGNLMAKAVFEHMRTLARADESRQAVPVVIAALIARISTARSHINAPALSIRRATSDERCTQ
ncbi:MAG TPA: hypothetical protein VN137_08820 [Sphingomonas sp.]|nr:hypothetical protein [Sphingomonas sp.]